MKKSLKKILFAILTVFAVFFVVACGNKEDTNINKEEVFQKSVEANNNIKSGNKLANAKIEVEGEGSVEFTIDTSIIKEPLAMKAIIEQKNENTKIIAISGSLPDGLEINYYSKMIGICEKYKKSVVLDCSGKALLEVLKNEYKPKVIKPNTEELSQLIGKDVSKNPDELKKVLKTVEN